MDRIDFNLSLNQNDSWNMSRLHFHDYAELLLPLSSPGKIFVSDKIYPLEAGTLYLIGERTLHRTIASGTHERYVLHISPATLEALSTPRTDFTRLGTSPFRAARMTEEEGENITRLFQNLEQLPEDGEYGADIRRIIALLELLLAAAPLLQTADAGECITNREFTRVAPILDYIQQHLTEPLNLEGIASRFYLSKHYLCRVFKAATGYSVKEYIIHNRIREAQRLLREGAGVQEAGERAGFTDNSYFIRTFGSLTGTSPGRYAREYQASDEVLVREDLRRAGLQQTVEGQGALKDGAS